MSCNNALASREAFGVTGLIELSEPKLDAAFKHNNPANNQQVICLNFMVSLSFSIKNSISLKQL